MSAMQMPAFMAENSLKQRLLELEQTNPPIGNR